MAVDVLINRRLRKIDIGVFCYFDGEQHQTRYFLNAVYMGLGARIVRITNETRRFWGIPLISYLASLFLVAFERKLYRMHLRVMMNIFVDVSWLWLWGVPMGMG